MVVKMMFALVVPMMVGCTLSAQQVNDGAQSAEDAIARACPSIHQVEAGIVCEVAAAAVQGFIELWGLTHPEMKSAVAQHHKLASVGATVALFHVDGVPGWYPATVAAELNKPETNAAMRAYLAQHMKAK